MLQSAKLKWFYWLAGLFVLVNSLAIFFEFYWLNGLPFVIVMVALTLFKLDTLLLVLAFLAPLSINLEDYLGDVGLGLFVPTEPLLFGVLAITSLRFFVDGKFDKKVLKHPISIAIAANIIWLLITSITSQNPLVSFKFVLSRIWFIVAFYFLGVHLFKNRKNITKFLWMYTLGVMCVIIYTVIHHATFGFAEDPAHYVMQPFFKDHTSYGAVQAMMYPFLIWTLLNKKISFHVKMIIVFVFAIFTIGLVLSYTRAAWVSLVAAFGVGVLFWWKIKFRTVALIGAVLLLGFFTFQNEILHSLKKNKTESSEDFAEHVQSISNVASDASNLERLNRWACAFRMFAERPIVGWGPGTYAFYYAPFQHSSELTIISTNGGDKGNAHSEYFGPLAEAGLLGSLTFVLIIVLVIYHAAKLYIRLEDKEMKALVMILLLGLITYFVHGILNNYLDTDKIATPFWGMIAALVAIEIYHEKPKGKSEKLTTQ
ncbi:MAG: O-antigen ligase family protein [Flavobacteriales bacterium]|nr:O-antigen ligase family protein [Flavobacteriales bacterium]